ncbi:MAG: toll/interleukin-1 receptor domain-containing protein [Methylovirgula sp.]
MTFVPGFSRDIFISYTHLDNEADEQNVRWVSEFRNHFESHLRKRLGSDDVSVFFDSSNLEAHQELASLVENVRGSAIFLAVLSRAYIAREWTIKELTAFNEAVQQGNAALAGINRIVAIEILPFEENEQIAALLAGPRGMGIKRTRFYYKDPETKIDYTLKPTNSDSYGKSIAELAESCVSLLRDLKARTETGTTVRPEPAKASALPLRSKTVLLAQSTDDLYDEAQQVRTYLEQFGAEVLPEGDYPGGGTEFAKAVRADLEHADLFVQLLSKSPSKRPSDLRQSENEPSQSYSVFQYEAAKRRRVPTLQWHRPDINPELITHHDRQLLSGPDVRVMGLQEFMKEIKTKFERQALEEAAAKRREEEAKQREEDAKRREPENAARQNGGEIPSDESAFFINAYDDDHDLANMLLQAFQARHRNAFLSRYKGSAKEKDEEIDENWINCDGLLLVFGEAPAHWVRAQLRRYIKLAGRRDRPPRCKKLLLAPGAQPDELGMATSFDAIDYRDGATSDRIQKFVGELCLSR